jgi:hypothetical protein
LYEAFVELKPTEEDKRMPECFICSTPVTEDFRCYGCDEYVCGSCDNGDETPMGPHDSGVHRETEASARI